MSRRPATGNVFNRNNRGSNNRARNPRAGDQAGH
jgi:hypothetical protein